MTFERHLELLCLLYRLAGITAALAGLALLPLGIGAGVLLATDEAPEMPAAFATVVFLAFGGALLVFAAVSAAVARQLSGRRPWSRMAGLTLAFLNLLVPPFGTALGAYAYWVLLQQRAREVLGEW